MLPLSCAATNVSVAATASVQYRKKMAVLLQSMSMNDAEVAGDVQMQAFSSYTRRVAEKGDC